ncbi:MAG: aromatic amino acid transport family protein [Candidatus Pacebacteria bacterium]|nr:aromatic amino acid transport family protein [Candidatus Paceibacterota bacterium]MDD3728961.1 aromatic amino acid transport family protein [Candidatus Paceibacterota bacterium]MDD5445830.1 aromatic amino acid transport family protein [Candidatus Paceibacterota bacterium]
MLKFIYGVSVISGTIIGIGLFALPYIAMKAGFFVVLGYFFILFPVAVIVHYFFAELALNTPDFKRLPGFVKIYLGKKTEKFSQIVIIFALSGTLLAYIILGGEFLYQLFSPVFSGSSFFYTTLYFLIGSLVIFFGIKAIAKVEFFGLILFFLILLFVFIKGFPYWEIENLLVKTGGAKDFFLPYGVILFSLWGAVIIPEVEETLGEEKEKLRKIVPVAVLIPALVSIIFILVIFGITGSFTSESALAGLRSIFGNGAVSATLFLGILTTFTSFIVLGLTLKKVLWYDMGLPKNLSWAIACFSPYFLYIIGLKNFIAVIGAVGAIMWAMEAILINLMYRKFSIQSPEKIRYPKLKSLVFPIIVFFLLGIFFEIYYFFNQA